MKSFFQFFIAVTIVFLLPFLSGAKMIDDRYFGPSPAQPGFNYWKPMVMHLAISSSTGISKGENTTIPLYWGYIEFKDDFTMSFTKKTSCQTLWVDMVMESIMKHGGLVPGRLEITVFDRTEVIDFKDDEFFMIFMKRLAEMCKPPHISASLNWKLSHV